MLRNTGLRAATSVSLNRRALVVRASETPVDQPAAAAPQQEVVVEKVAVPAATATPVAMTTDNKTVTFTDAMAFANPVGPETINGRLAMLGVFAAIGAELSTGQGFIEQFQGAAPIVIATMATIAGASLVPILKGADPTAAFGPLTHTAEMANGRAAMLGLAALIIIELTKGSALF